MKTLVKNNHISIVMRTMGDRPKELTRALSSIANNTYSNIEVILVYQGESENSLYFLSELAKTFKSIDLKIIQNKSTEDCRSQNLNIGWEAASGRYIGFLDDDDTLECTHLSSLHDALFSSKSVWSYGHTILIKETPDLVFINKTAPFYRTEFSFRALWNANFIPIHSFLIDRNRLHFDLQHSPFCEDLTRSEDWDFLIRLAFYHQPKLIDIFTCNYHVCTDGRNTIVLLTGNSKNEKRLEAVNAWSQCKVLLDQRKCNLIQSLWWAEDLLSLKSQSQSETLRWRVRRKISRLMLFLKKC